MYSFIFLWKCLNIQPLMSKCEACTYFWDTVYITFTHSLQCSCMDMRRGFHVMHQPAHWVQLGIQSLAKNLWQGREEQSLRDISTVCTSLVSQTPVWAKIFISRGTGVCYTHCRLLAMGQSAVEDPVGVNSWILHQRAKHTMLSLLWRLQTLPELWHLFGVMTWVQIDSPLWGKRGRI